MSAEQVVRRLRSFLFALAGLMAVGTLGELWLAEHVKEPLQFIPFGLCGLALVAVAGAWRWPRPATLWTLRGVMALTALGSALGMYEHLAANAAFELEIRPNAMLSAVWLDVLHGAAPILAPGVLLMMAAVALAATYAHPALARPAPPAAEQGAKRPAGKPA